jgi:hypothetical protein
MTGSFGIERKVARRVLALFSQRQLSEQRSDFAPDIDVRCRVRDAPPANRGLRYFGITGNIGHSVEFFSEGTWQHEFDILVCDRIAAFSISQIRKMAFQQRD